MASITKRGDKWRALIRMQGHPSLSGTFNSHKTAKAWAREVEDRITRGEVESPSVERSREVQVPSFPTLAEAAERRIQYLGIDQKSTTARRIKWWVAKFGPKRIDEIRKSHVQSVVDELRKTPRLHGGYKIRESNAPRSEATITRYITALSGVLSEYVDPEDGLPYNPARKIKTLPSKEMPLRYREPEEIDAILEACKRSTYPRLYFLALTAYYTGARRGELLSLTWDKVNLEKGEAFLNPEQTKTKQARVLLWVGDALEQLQSWAKIDEAAGMSHGYLFPSPRYPDRPLVGLDRIWKRTCAEVGIKMRWHDWRHQSGTEVILSGHSSIMAAEHLGHSSLVMTKRYTNLVTARKREVLEKTFGNRRPPLGGGGGSS